MRWFWAKMLGIGVGQIALGVALYGGRIHTEIAFTLLPLLALGLYAWLIWHEGLARRSLLTKLILTPLLALLALAISTTCLATIAFNLWGT